MPNPHNDSASRRSSFFGFKQRSPSPLTSITNRSDASKSASPKVQRKKSRFANPLSSEQDLASMQHSRSQSSDINVPAPSTPPSDTTTNPAQSTNHRSSMLRKSNRPSSIFGSLKSLRFTEDDDSAPPSAATTPSSLGSPSAPWADHVADEHINLGRSRHVIHHGEVQISARWLPNKKEYMVLTETHLIRFRNQAKAKEIYPCVQTTPGRNGVQRHVSSKSVDSAHDSQSQTSDNSGDRLLGIPLNHIVAVHLPDETRPQSSLEVAHLETDSSQGSFFTIALPDIDARDAWLRAIRDAANQVRLVDPEPITQSLAEYAARVVEREEDYSPSRFKIFKVVKCTSLRGGRMSADDSVKTAPFVCLLVIGVHKVHLIQLPKSALRSSTPTLVDLGEGHSHGILNVTAISVASRDDEFSLAFRSPFQRVISYQLSSLAAADIALSLKLRDRALRPEWTNSPFLYNGPSPFEEDLELGQEDQTEFNGWPMTLTAFCVAYGVDPSVVMYSVEYEVEDPPRFVLFPPARCRRATYTPVELLAILRSLRYNEYFGTLDFSNVSLDVLIEAYDTHGQEHICEFQKTGAPIGISFEDQAQSSLLVSEIRALAATNRRLRRLDFSGSVDSHLSDPAAQARLSRSSGIFEALYPICSRQSTNLDWFCVNGLPLQEQDLEYLISLLAQRACHVRGLELGGCSLNDHSVQLILDTLRTQSNTLEALVLSSNNNRILPTPLSTSLGSFECIRRLDLSYLAVSASDEPLLAFETLRGWRLEDLSLAGTTLNHESVDAICMYLRHKQSEILRSLVVSICGLTGAKIADMMEAMTTPGVARPLCLDVSDNPIAIQGHDRLVSAIAMNQAPTHLAMCQYEYDTEENFAELLLALASNRSIRSLSIARVSIPGTATETTTVAMERLLKENITLHTLDISGEESRLEATRFGPGIIRALAGLKNNMTLTSLRVESQKLGLHGAAVLSEVLRQNTALHELHCEHNSISLSGFVDMCNAVQVNKTLLYMPSLTEGRESQLRQMEDQIREARTMHDRSAISPRKVSSMRRSFAKVGGMTLSGSYTSPKKTLPVPQWTHQDEQHAYRMIADGWEEHIQRLETYLERNRRLAAGQDVNESEWEVRPGTSGSISGLYEKVASQSTPRAEKHVELGVNGGPALGRSASPPLPRLPDDYVRLKVPSSPRTKSPEVVPSEYLRGHAPSRALAGAAPKLKPSVSRSLSSSSLESDALSLPSLEIDRTPIFEEKNPFVLMTTDLERSLTDDSTKTLSPETSSSSDPSSTEDISATSSRDPEVEVILSSPKSRRSMTSTVKAVIPVRVGAYKHDYPPATPPKD